MQSTLKLRESDPHDVFAVAPEVVPAAWADKVLADIARDAKSHLSESHPSESAASDQQPPAASGAAAGAAAPAVDTTFRATAAGAIRVPSERPSDRPPTGRWAKSAVMLMFALSSAAAAAGWQHYGDAAKQMISHWAPPFTLNASPPPERTALAGQPDTPAVQAAAADPAQPQNAPPAQPPESVSPAATASSPDTAQLQSMARDVAAMGQQIEQLKASLAELRASQQAMARDVAKTSEIKPSEVRTSVPIPRPKIPAPPRSAAAPSRKPMPAYAPLQAAAPTQLAPMLPRPVPPPASLQAGPPPQAAPQPNDEPVIRPPMPLR